MRVIAWVEVARSLDIDAALFVPTPMHVLKIAQHIVFMAVPPVVSVQDDTEIARFQQEPV